MYYYLEDVVPKIPETQDVKVLKAPRFLVSLCESMRIHNFQANEEDFIIEEEQAANNDIGADVLDNNENNENNNAANFF